VDFGLNPNFFGTILAEPLEHFLFNLSLDML